MKLYVMPGACSLASHIALIWAGVPYEVVVLTHADAGRNLLEQAQMDELLADLVSDIHKAWGPVFVPERYVTRKANEDDARQAAFGQLDKQYARLDEMMQGREWALFGRRTVADAYLFVMCRWKNKSPVPLSMYPALDAFKRRLDADPGVQRALREEPSQG